MTTLLFILTEFWAEDAELFDGGIRGGYVDHRDILATTMGGITMSVTIPLFQPKKKRYRKLDKWNGGYDYDK